MTSSSLNPSWRSPGRITRWGLALSPQHRVYLAFFFYAFALGGLYARLAEIQTQMGASKAALGLALIGVSLGTLTMLTFGGRLIERLGYRRVFFIFLPLLPTIYAVASHASHPVLLFFLLIPAGWCIGAVEIIVNMEADRVEHVIGRRIMNRAHGFWSFGFVGAGLVAAKMAGLGVSPQWHLALVMPLVWVAVWLVLGRYEPAPPRAAQADAAPGHFAWPTGAVLVLVLFSVSAMLMEGAAIDWSAIYMRDVFGLGAAFGAIAVSTAAFAQGVTRLFADPYVDRFGPVRVSLVLLSVMLMGTVLMLFAASPWQAFAGLLMIGMGSSVIFPLAMSAAARRTDRHAATNVASLAQLAFVAFLLGPPLLGLAAEQWGIRAAFGVGIPLILMSFWAVRGLRA